MPSTAAKRVQGHLLDGYGDYAMSQQEVAVALSLSKGRVRQIERTAIRKCRIILGVEPPVTWWERRLLDKFKVV